MRPGSQRERHAGGCLQADRPCPVTLSTSCPGFVPGIHVLARVEDVDAQQLGFAELRSKSRPKPETSGLGTKLGHDEKQLIFQWLKRARKRWLLFRSDSQDKAFETHRLCRRALEDGWMRGSSPRMTPNVLPWG